MALNKMLFVFEIENTLLLSYRKTNLVKNFGAFSKMQPSAQNKDFLFFYRPYMKFLLDII